MVAVFANLDADRPKLEGMDLSLRTEVPLGHASALVAPLEINKVESRAEIRRHRHEAPTPSEYAALLLSEMVDAANKDVSQYPRNPRVHANLGFALSKSGRIEDAVSEFREAIALGSTDYSVQWALVTGLLQAGHDDAARLMLNEMRRARPDDTRAMFGLAASSIHTGDVDSAVRWWGEVVELEPKNHLAHYLLGLGLLGVADVDTSRVLHHLKRATRLSPRDADYLQGLGIGHSIAGHPTQALRAFQGALHLQPGMTESIEAVAKTLVGMGRLEDALARTEAFVERHASDVAARELLAWLYFESRQYARTRSQLFAALTTVDPKREGAGSIVSRLTNNLGITYSLSGDNYHAEQMFRRAIQADTSVSSQNNLARLLAKTRRPSEALAVLNETKAAHPEHEDTRLALASVLMLLRRPREAVDELEGWVQTDAATPQSWAVLGALLTDEVGRIDDAISVLETAFHRFERHFSVVNNFAYALLMAGRHSEARPVLERVYDGTARMGPTPQLTATWGLLKLWEDDKDAARDYYATAAEQASQEDVELGDAIRQKAQLEFARAFIREGDRVSAIEELNRGLRIDGRWDLGEKLSNLRESLVD